MSQSGTGLRVPGANAAPLEQPLGNLFQLLPPLCLLGLAALPGFPLCAIGCMRLIYAAVSSLLLGFHHRRSIRVLTQLPPAVTDLLQNEGAAEASAPCCPSPAGPLRDMIGSAYITRSQHVMQQKITKVLEDNPYILGAT